MVQTFGGGLRLHKELGLARDSEAIVGPAGHVTLTLLDHDLAVLEREAGLVTHVPAQRFKKWRDEVNPSLGFEVALGQVVSLVRLEVPNQVLEALHEVID